MHRKQEKYKFVFLGTPEFANIVLDKIVNVGWVPDFVICNPDRPVGRKKIITPPPAKKRVMNYEPKIRDRIKIFQPEKLNLENWKREIGEIDFAIVSAYGKIILKEILETAKFGFIGVHPSLLPKYRGATPIRSAMLAGEEKTGVTLFLTDDKMDHGPIINQKELIIDKDYDYPTLRNKLACLGGELLPLTLEEYLKGNIKPKDQNHNKATFTKKFSVEDAKIEYSDLLKAYEGDKEKSLEIDRKIKALNPEPGAWTIIEKPSIYNLTEGKRVKLLDSFIEGSKIEIRRVQVEGKIPRKIS